MRSFIISVALLLSVAAFVAVYIGFMQRYCAEMLALSASLPKEEATYQNGIETLRAIERKWKEKKTLISYLMDHREVERVDIAFSDMKNAFYSGDFQQYTVYADEFEYAVTRLLQISGVTAENIF